MLIGLSVNDIAIINQGADGHLDPCFSGGVSERVNGQCGLKKIKQNKYHEQISGCD